MPVKIACQKDGSLLLAVKVVPGSSRDRIVGLHGEAVKVAVTAPPEGGKANRAVCRLLAEALGVHPANVTVQTGAGGPFKTVRLVGLSAARVRLALGLSHRAES